MVLQKQIWSYWTGPKNDIFWQCQFSWMYYARGWKINIINPNNIDRWNLDLPSTFSSLTPAAQSDIIRLDLLYKYGGLWLDATILLVKNLQWLEKVCSQHRKYAYFACKAWDAYFVESWLIAVNCSHNPHIKKWRDALFSILELSPRVTDSIYYSGKRYTRNDSYFMIYQCYCYLVDNDKKFCGAKVLSNSVQLAFVPVIFPLDNLDPRCFIKFTANCRRRAKYCQSIFNVVMIIILLSITKIIYKIFQKRKNLKF